MTKLGGGGRDRQSFRPAGFQVVIERDLPQRDHHAVLLEEPQFVSQEPAAVFKLIECRFIPRWGATHRGPDVAIQKRQSIAAVRRRRLIGKPVSVQCFIKPIAASITGEHATGPIPTVGCRSEPKDIESGLGIAEARDGPSPIRPVHELTSFRLSDRLAIGDQTRTRRAVCDGCVQYREASHKVRQCSMNENVIPLAGDSVSC